MLEYYSNAIEELKSHLLSVSGKMHNEPVYYELSELLRSKINEDKLIHICGAGRSMEVGLILGEELKRLGYSNLGPSVPNHPIISYLGKTLARPVHEEDIVIAISGSGNTGETVRTVKACKEQNATILGITANPTSCIGNLSDYVLKVEGYTKDKVSHVEDNIKGNHAPITPLGTQFELSAFLSLVGLANQVYNEDFSIDSMGSEFEYYLNKTINHPNHKKSLESLLSSLCAENLSINGNGKLFITGTGTSYFVARMAAMRLQHTGIRTELDYSWWQRQEGDMLLALSGSGNTKQTLEKVLTAVQNKLQVGVLTSFPESQIGLLGRNNTLFVAGRTEKYSLYDEFHLYSAGYASAFELVSACILDGIATEINETLKRTDVRKEHANI